MKYSIDTHKGELVATVIGVDREGIHSHPLAAAIMQNLPCETITVAGAAKFHYFKSPILGQYTVTFNVAQFEHGDLNMIAERVNQSQQWLSAEMSRLKALSKDLETLKRIQPQ